MMDRLTIHDEYDHGALSFVKEAEGRAVDMNVILDRLTAYEDTGLMPEAINGLVKSFLGTLAGEIAEKTGSADMSRIHEIADAEVEGRLIVLPCKVGDTFYTLEKYCSDGEDDRIKTRHWGSDCDEYCCTYPCDAETRVTEWKWASPIRILQEQKHIGKTVFLTREEAEAALKEAHNGE